LQYLTMGSLVLLKIFAVFAGIMYFVYHQCAEFLLTKLVHWEGHDLPEQELEILILSVAV